MPERAVVAISSDFLSSFAALPKKVQGKVTEFINKFRNNPTSNGINYEKLQNNSDSKICSVRIDDTYRGIVVRQPETGVYILLWVDHHDEAYAWAKNKRCSVNRQTGSVQVYDVQPVVVKHEEISKAASLFGALSDEQLIKLGLPEEQITFLRSITTAEEFNSQKQSFSLDVYEALSWIVEGIPFDEVFALLESEKASCKNDNLAEALNNPESMKSFVIVEGEEELHRIMAEPLEKWRVFLHPTQRKLVERDFSGSARVLGGAGTGKTVVAMHRAKHLASTLPDDEKVLFTTFTANLASDIKDNLRKICTVSELRKVDVINIDAWVSRFLRSHGYEANIIYGDALETIWEEAVSQNDLNSEFPVSFYEEEYNRVVVAQEALSLKQYVAASRVGRGTRLNRIKRIQIWNVFETYLNLMKERRVRDINTAMYECRLILEKEKVRSPYKYVIVDEGQDLSANALRLLRAIAGEDHPNDIFIVGDAHQRIYKNKAALSKSGIFIRGRSSILRINYRTTEEIRKSALALLSGISFDNLDDEVDDDRCQSLTHGQYPQLYSYNTADEEFQGVLKEINHLTESGVLKKDICVIARTQKLVDDYVRLFTESGIRAYKIKRSKGDERTLDGIRVATMHRVKGLEFQYVFIVAVNKRIVPLDSAISHTDEISERETIMAEKCLLYVSLTRAQKGAYISSYGQASEFIKQ